MKYFGNKNPFSTVTDVIDTSTQTGSRQEVDFYGVVTFEVELADIVGVSYSNVLVFQNRIVFESKTITKRSFPTVDDFFSFYSKNNGPLSKQRQS